MRNKRIFAIFMVLAALSACGQKGPLRLESEKSQDNSQAKVNSTEQADSQREQTAKTRQSENDSNGNGKGGAL